MGCIFDFDRVNSYECDEDAVVHAAYVASGRVVVILVDGVSVRMYHGWRHFVRMAHSFEVIQGMEQGPFGEYLVDLA